MAAPELALELEPTTEDRLLQAESVVRSYCGWHIAPSRTETVTVDGPGSGVALLPSLHVTAVASVSDDGAEVAASGYTWRRNGVLSRVGAWGTRDIEVTFTHGYEDVPPEVTGVVQAVAQRATENPGSRAQESSGPFTERRAGTGATLELLDAEKAILDRYRLPALA